MTPRAFFNAIEGYEQKVRNDYELQRLVAFFQVGAWVKIESPQNLWKFSWEIEEKKEVKTSQEINKQIERAKQLDHTLKNRK